jgi:hypothetical protein
MGGLFSKPKMPEVPEPPPTVDDAAAMQASDAERRRQRRATGLGASMLTGGQISRGNVGTKKLLGS